MTNYLLPPATIGIIGAGQLAKMLAQSAIKMGYTVHLYDPNPTSCAFPLAQECTVASFDDAEALMTFASKVDVLTYEFENINGDVLNTIKRTHYFPQGSDLLLISQDRLKEKAWLNEIGATTLDYCEVNSEADLKVALDELGYPAVLKTRRFGYDGKGQVVIQDKEDLGSKKADINSIIDQGGVLEAYYDFDFEASIIVSRDLMGHVYCFEPSVNIHKNGILYASLAGAEINHLVRDKMEKLACRIAEQANLIGVCGVEFFVTANGDVRVNEIAPRPHNSGHYTIEGCNVSQFDQHILAVTGRALIQPRLLTPTLMVNILGQHMADLDQVTRALPQAIYHIYGKEGANHQRKMGHVTLTHPDVGGLEEVLDSDLLKHWRDLF